MPKKPARSSASPPRARQRPQELDERLAPIRAQLDAIEARLGAVAALGQELARVHDLTREALAQAQDSHQLASGLDARLNHLTLAVAEGIQHVERAEARVNGVVSRARRQLREAGLEHPGLEAEAAQLQLIDGGSSEPARVQPVQQDVAEAVGEDPLMTRLRQLRLSR